MCTHDKMEVMAAGWLLGKLPFESFDTKFTKQARHRSEVYSLRRSTIGILLEGTHYQGVYFNKVNYCDTIWYVMAAPGANKKWDHFVAWTRLVGVVVGHGDKVSASSRHLYECCKADLDICMRLL